MDYSEFNTKFPFKILEAEKKDKDSKKDNSKESKSENDDSDDTKKFPKNTKVDLNPEEEIGIIPQI